MNRRFELALLVVYAVVASVTTWHHEPWRDEAQAWLIVRDLDLAGVLTHMLPEGTLPLWHFVIYPLPRLGLPYGSMFVVHVAIAVAAVAIFLFASPFRRWHKLAFVLSYLMLYEYAVVARCYGVSVLLLFALAAIHPERGRRVGATSALLIALALTNFHALIIALAIAAEWGWSAWRDRGSPHPMAVWSAIGLACIAGGLIFAEAMEAYRWWFPRFFSVTEALHTFVRGIADWRPRIVASGVVFTILAVLSGDLIRRPRALFLLYMPIAFFTLTPMVYASEGARHRGFVALVMIYVIWTEVLSARDGEAPASSGWIPAGLRPALAGGIATSLLFGCLLLSLPKSGRAVVGDIRGAFSMSQAMARHIGTQLEDVPIAAYPAPFASSILPHLPEHRFWYPGTGQWGTYVSWSEHRRPKTRRAMRKLWRSFEGGERPWLVTSRRLWRPRRWGYALRHQETGLGEIQRGNEVYYLYEPVARQRREQAAD